MVFVVVVVIVVLVDAVFVVIVILDVHVDLRLLVVEVEFGWVGWWWMSKPIFVSNPTQLRLSWGCDNKRI